MIYVASPYSDPVDRIEIQRYHEVVAYCCQLVHDGYVPFSPILHWHHPARRHGLPGDAAFWSKYNKAMMMAASHMHVLCLPGWEESKGVQAEIKWWRENNIQAITYAGRDTGES